MAHTNATCCCLDCGADFDVNLTRGETEYDDEYVAVDGAGNEIEDECCPECGAAESFSFDGIGGRGHRGEDFHADC